MFKVYAYHRESLFLFLSFFLFCFFFTDNKPGKLTGMEPNLANWLDLPDGGELASSLEPKIIFQDSFKTSFERCLSRVFIKWHDRSGDQKIATSLV